MADLNAKGVRIQVLISEEGFNDALYFTPAEFEAMKDEEIEAAKRERKDAWIERQNTPSERAEPTTEELLGLKEELVKQLDEVNSKLTK